MNKKMLKAWKDTLKMWKWIATVWKSNKDNIQTWRLKEQWMTEHEPRRDCASDCYLCDAEDSGSCQTCPLNSLLDEVAVSIACELRGLDWYDDPVGFYSYLVALDEKAREIGLIP